MRYIKGYRIFESVLSDGEMEVKQYLKDILQELEDIGFSVDIYCYSDNTIVVDIYKVDDYFKFGLVKEYTLSAIDYMELMGWSITKYESNAKYDDDEVMKVSISFKNNI